MKKHSTTLILVLVFAAAFATVAGAQDISKVVTPLRVQVVVSKYQGEKKISSLPYTLTVNASDPRTASNRASLRMGAQVPIVTTTRTSATDATPMNSVSYKDVGTSVDCTATLLDESRFKLEITIEDSSVESVPGAASNVNHPAFRSFRSNNTLLLKDGQTSQFTTATDKVSGEVVKVDVTLTVVK